MELYRTVRVLYSSECMCGMGAEAGGALAAETFESKRELAVWHMPMVTIAFSTCAFAFVIGAMMKMMYLFRYR